MQMNGTRINTDCTDKHRKIEVGTYFKGELTENDIADLITGERER